MSIRTDNLEHLQSESDILFAQARSCYAPDPAEAAILARRIHDWQAIDARLEREIAALTLRRQMFSTQNLFHKTLLSPWRRVPVELWIEIFTYALPSDWAEAYAGRRRLYMAQVCCAWRDIVFGIPRFWSIFRIFHKYNPPARYGPAIRAETERIPVDVSLVLDIDMTDESSMSDTVLRHPNRDIALPESWTIEDIHIECVTTASRAGVPITPAVGAVLSCRNTLRILTLWGSAYHSGTTKTAAMFPVLEELTLAYDAIDLAFEICAPDLRALTMIGDVDPPSEPNSTFKAYVDLLKRSPEVLKLESLALLDVVVVADEFAQTLRRMPSLTSLEVGVYSTDCYDSPAPLNRLTTLLQRPHDPHPTDLLPNLTCLVIGYRRPKGASHFEYSWLLDRLRVLAITRRPLFVAHTTGFATLTTFGKSYENVPDELTIDAIRNRNIRPFYIRGW
ncbi:uncharacterized protein SCHCODRAFT_01350067 [Schizophyllum commune H4-8]|nr:uncharacterized protein SCHCODRAFT_01350067 [Schizophyllum commune H4-8]KAI5896047.1 hypothetical protein SCHCODRAFT_01350067 [Schizophyllum commune H4-8]